MNTVWHDAVSNHILLFYGRLGLRMAQKEVSPEMNSGCLLKKFQKLSVPEWLVLPVYSCYNTAVFSLSSVTRQKENALSYVDFVIFI